MNVQLYVLLYHDVIILRNYNYLGEQPSNLTDAGNYNGDLQETELDNLSASESQSAEVSL